MLGAHRAMVLTMPLRLISSILPSQTVITDFHLTEWGLGQPISGSQN